jgi:hypothetical protein
MPIRAECSAGHAMMVPDHRAGTRLRCPRCGVELRVPGTPVKAAAPAVKPPAPVASEPPVPAAVKAASHLDPTALVIPSTQVEPPQEQPAVNVPPPDTLMGEVSETIVPPRPVAASVSKPPAPVAKAWSPPRDQSAAAFYLSLVLAALAIFGVSPAVWEWYELWRNPDEPEVPPWVFALLITGVLQLAYAVYLAQVPDWSALWATTIATLAAAAAWAALLGTTLLGRDESALVLLFRYADKLEGNRAAMWCFIMLCFTSVLAYFLGLTAVRWQRAYHLLRRVRAG